MFPSPIVSPFLAVLTLSGSTSFPHTLLTFDTTLRQVFSPHIRSRLGPNSSGTTKPQARACTRDFAGGLRLHINLTNLESSPFCCGLMKSAGFQHEIVFGGNSEGTSVVRPTSRPDFHAIRLRSFASAYTNACHASCTCCHLCLNKLDLTTDDGSNHFGMRSVVMKIVFFGNKEKKFKY